MVTDQELKTYWLTKYALTKGVVKVLGYLDNGDGGKGRYLTNIGLSDSYFYYGPDEYTESESEAVSRVLEMLGKREESIRRELDKLERIRREAERGQLVYAK